MKLMSTKSISDSSSSSKSEFKRLILIGIQVKNMFDELTDETDEEKALWQKAVEEKYIKSFTFYAIKSGKAYAELEIVIDWTENQRQIDKGNIIIKTKSPDGILAPTKNVASRFRDYVNNNGFQVRWRLRYADHVNIEEARKKFNTSAGSKIERADDCDDYECREFQVGDLPELTYIMRL